MADSFTTSWINDSDYVTTSWLFLLDFILLIFDDLWLKQTAKQKPNRQNNDDDDDDMNVRLSHSEV